MKANLLDLRRSAFTLLEMLVAMTILSVLAPMLFYVISQTMQIWQKEEARAEVYQNARAALDLISRQVSQAILAADNSLQFIQNPPLPSAALLRTPTDSLFWQAPLSNSPKGNLCVVGYYVNSKYQLQRIWVKPDSTLYTVSSATVGGTTASTVPWLSNGALYSTEDTNTTVVDGVLGMWIRCLDISGLPIPWPQGSGFPATIKYDTSRDPVKTRGAAGLPAAVEITLVLVDSRSVGKFAATLTDTSIDKPVSVSDADYAKSVTDYCTLLRGKSMNPYVFTLRANLSNGAYALTP